MTEGEFLYLRDTAAHLQFLLDQCGAAETLRGDPATKRQARELLDSQAWLFRSLLEPFPHSAPTENALPGSMPGE